MNKLTLLLLIIFLSLALVVRLYKIDNPLADWHEFRQADTAGVSRHYFQNGIDLLHPRYHDLSNIQSGKDNPQGYRFVEFPLYNAAHALLTRVSGLPIDQTGRVFSVALSVLSLIGLFLLARSFWGDGVALLVLLFASVNAYWVYYSRVVLPEPLMIALGLWSLLSFVQFIRGKSVIYAVLGGLLFGLAILVKPFILVWFLGIPLALILKKDYQKILVFGAIVVIGLIPFILWRLWSLKSPEGIPVYAWLLNGDGIRFRPAFFRWLFYERLVKLILGGWGTAALLIGLAKKWKDEDLIPLGMLFGSILYLFIIATGNVRHDYYQILFFPPLALFIGRGLWQLTSSKWTGKLQGIAVASSIFIASTGFGWYEVIGYYQINHPEIVEAGKNVDLLVPKNAKVIAPYNGDTAFLYYTNRQGWPLGYDIDKKIGQGASVYASVVFDDETNSLMKKYRLIKKTSKFVIIDLVNK